ncbi:MAG: formate--tetrahydrofolate ligase [Bacteroides graminisolvens]
MSSSAKQSYRFYCYFCTFKIINIAFYEVGYRIARTTELKKIKQVAEEIGIPRDEVENYGRYIAKIPDHLIDDEKVKKSNLILVTAITATKAGIGKTTVSIGLALGLNKIGKKAIVALREPSLGPCFGMKGGAAGGGYAQVLPMEKINLHFTGRFFNTSYFRAQHDCSLAR